MTDNYALVTYEMLDVLNQAQRKGMAIPIHNVHVLITMLSKHVTRDVMRSEEMDRCIQLLEGKITKLEQRVRSLEAELEYYHGGGK